MHASKMTMSLALLILSFTTSVFSVPLPQGAGVGAGCDAILTDADTGSGLAVKEAGQNAASLIKSTGLRVRQGAGVGAACNSILTDADTASGMAVKIAGNNIASNLRNAEGKVGLKSRQLDKVGAGVAAVVGALPGGGAPAGIITSSTGSIDGAGTSGSAAIGEQIGEYELEIGYGIGNAVPSALISKAKRQLDKVGAGVAAIVAAVPGGGEAANIIAGSMGSIDGAGTSGSAEIGQQIGDAEVQIGTGAGNLVPSKVPAIPGAPGLPKLPL